MNFTTTDRKYLAELVDDEIQTREQLFDIDTGESTEEMVEACKMYRKLTGKNHRWAEDQMFEQRIDSAFHKAFFSIK